MKMPHVVLLSAILFLLTIFNLSSRADDVPSPPAGWQSVAPLLSNADVGAGKKLANACIACHSFDKNGGAKIGPNLYGIVNGPHAHMESFGYSSAMKGLHDKKWTYESLDRFIFNPKNAIPGNKMTFPGVKDAQDRANIIAYLRTLADDPAPLPKTK